MLVHIWIRLLKGLPEPDNYFYLQRHTLLSQSGVHYVVLGNGLHPQQDHDKRGEEVDMKQSSTGKGRCRRKQTYLLTILTMDECHTFRKKIKLTKIVAI